MGALGGLLLGLFAGLASFFVKWFAKKTAFAAAAITTFGLLTVGLFAGMQALLAGVLFAFPVSNPILSTLIWVCLPPPLFAGIAAAIAADTAVSLYRWNVENLKLASYIT